MLQPSCESDGAVHTTGMDVDAGGGRKAGGAHPVNQHGPELKARCQTGRAWSDSGMLCKMLQVCWHQHGTNTDCNKTRRLSAIPGVLSPPAGLDLPLGCRLYTGTGCSPVASGAHVFTVRYGDRQCICIIEGAKPVTTHAACLVRHQSFSGWMLYYTSFHVVLYTGLPFKVGFGRTTCMADHPARYDATFPKTCSPRITAVPI